MTRKRDMAGLLKTLSMVVALGLASVLVGCERTPETGPAIAENTSTGDYDPTYLEMGEKIAKTRCGVCHTLKPTGDSPRSDAPPLRTVLSDYNPDALADDFREHLHVGHPDMPDFGFNVKQVEGLLAYLTSIQETPRAVE